MGNIGAWGARDRRNARRQGVVASTARLAVTAGVSLILVLGLLLAVGPGTKAAGPCAEQGYANGQEFCFFVTNVITDPSPGLLAHAEPFYIAAYFPMPVGCVITVPSTCHPETLPSGYMPQCDPCFHGGALDRFAYHDHILAGAPGFGNNGTAGLMEGPWVVIVVAYNPAYTHTPTFAPFESAATLAAGESNGNFLTINPGAANPYEVNTGVVLIFGVQPLGS